MAASVSLLPGATAAAKRPLSDRRQALDRAIVLKAAAQKAVEAAAEPVRHCDVIITEVARLRTELAELYQQDQRLTGEWIAGGRIGPDPGDAKDTATLNSRIVAIQACRPAAGARCCAFHEGLRELKKLHSVAAALRQGDDPSAFQREEQVGLCVRTALNQEHNNATPSAALGGE